MDRRFKASKYASVPHPCIQCTVNSAGTAQADRVVPTMCLTNNGRIVETIVARVVEMNDSDVLANSKKHSDK
jgi:hypothetical protein